MIELIYCANGNPKFAKIAIDAGFSYGAQLPGHVAFPIVFADQNWKTPSRAAYMKALAVHRPRLATVWDWEKEQQLSEVLSWAEDAAEFVDEIIIIPKVPGGIVSLPRFVGGKKVRLGFSVPTRHGGTAVWAGEFHGWPVHLLGGSPQAQMKWSQRLNVVSADGNYVQKWQRGIVDFGNPVRPHTPVIVGGQTLKEADGEKWNNGEGDAPYEAFRRSCLAIMMAWQQKGTLPVATKNQMLLSFAP